jgi:spore coat protein U-like protein
MFTSSIKKCAQITVGATALSLLLGGGLAFAQATTNLGVSADVTNNCTIAAAPALTVGNYNVLNGSPLTPTATLAVTCTAGAVATIGLDAGANGSHAAVGTTRAMANGANYLSYELYSDAGLSTVWGNVEGTWVVEPAAPSTTAVDYTVYASVPAQQSVPAGTYTDSVAVTVSF